MDVVRLPTIPISPPEKFLGWLPDQLAVAQNPAYTKRAKVCRIDKTTQKGYSIEADVKIKSAFIPGKTGDGGVETTHS